MKPLWISGRLHAPSRAKYATVIHFYSFLVSQKGQQLKQVPRQRGLWTPPPGVSTAVFGDSFVDLMQKSDTVDMWTPCSLIILKATTVHQHPGGPRLKNRIKSLSRTLPPPLVHCGEPFHCPPEQVRESSRYGVWIWAYSFKLLAGKQDAIAEAILRSVTMACTCCVELDETAHLSFGIRSIC